MRVISYKLKVLILAGVALCSLAPSLYAAEPLSLTNTAPNLTQFSPDKDGKNDNVAILFTLNKAAAVTVSIKKNSNFVQRIVIDKNYSAGKHYVWWTGSDSTGKTVANGEYKFVVKAINGKETKYASGVVNVACKKPEIFKISFDNQTFSPDNNGIKDLSVIRFRLNTYSRLKVTISNYKGVIRTLYDGEKYRGGAKYIWNGRDSFGSPLVNGSYRLDITASSPAGIAKASSLVKINNPKPRLLFVRPTVNPFSPNGDRIKDITGFTYKLESDAYIQVKVFNYKGEVKSVFSGYRKPGIYFELWDGFNNSGWLLPNGSYRYEVTASNIAGSVVRTGTVKIEGVVFSGPYSITVSVSARKLYLYRGRALIKTYPVAVGMPSYPTPIGNYKITRKDINPTWYPPKWADVKSPVAYPKSPLGPRRLLLNDPSYGIHGTLSRNAIGRAVTHGCIRLYNEQIIELYNIVPVGTMVKIVR